MVLFGIKSVVRYALNSEHTTCNPQEANILKVTPDLLMQAMVVLALTLRVSSVVLGSPDPDPYLPIENVTCNVVFGCPESGLVTNPILFC